MRMTYGLEDGVGVLHLDDGKANAIGPEWLAEAAAALDQAEGDPSRALVVLGRDGFFSAGLDLKLLPALPADAMRAVSLDFVALVRRLFLFPKPVVAASAGHALAGGFMLYCSADVRLAVAGGPARYGLTEVAAGVPVIGPTAAVVAAAVPQHEHPAVLLHGRRLSADEAAALGVVHEIIATDSMLQPRALKRARAVADAVEPRAYHVTKLALRAPLVDAAAAVATALAPRIPAGNPLATPRRPPSA